MLILKFMFSKILPKYLLSISYKVYSIVKSVELLGRKILIIYRRNYSKYLRNNKKGDPFSSYEELVSCILFNHWKKSPESDVKYFWNRDL